MLAELRDADRQWQPCDVTEMHDATSGLTLLDVMADGGWRIRLRWKTPTLFSRRRLAIERNIGYGHGYTGGMIVVLLQCALSESPEAPLFIWIACITLAVATSTYFTNRTLR